MGRNGLEKREKREGLLAKLRLADDDGGEVDDFDDETLQNVLEVHLDGGAAHALEEGDDESPDEPDSIGVLAEEQHDPVELGLVHGDEAAGRLVAGGDAKRVVRGEKRLEENHPAVDVDAVAPREELLDAALLDHVGHAGLEVFSEASLALPAEERAQRGPEPALLAAVRLQRGVAGRERRVVGGGDVEERGGGREQAARVQPEEEVDDFLPFLEWRERTKGTFSRKVLYCETDWRSRRSELRHFQTRMSFWRSPSSGESGCCEEEERSELAASKSDGVTEQR